VWDFESAIMLTHVTSTPARDWQIFRWPFQRARWISARASKDMRERDDALDVQMIEDGCIMVQHSNDLAATQGHRLAGDDRARREYEACSLLQSLPLKRQTHHDQCLDRLVHCRFDDLEIPDLMPSTPDLLAGCNSPPPTARELTNVQSNHTLTPTHPMRLTPTHPMRLSYEDDRDFDVVMRYGEMMRASHALHGSRASWLEPVSAAPTHAFDVFSSSARDADIQRHAEEARDRVRDRQLLAEVRASSLMFCSSPTDPAEMAELGYTDCDLSYLVVA